MAWHNLTLWRHGVMSRDVTSWRYVLHGVAPCDVLTSRRHVTPWRCDVMAWDHVPSWRNVLTSWHDVMSWHDIRWFLFVMTQCAKANPSETSDIMFFNLVTLAPSNSSEILSRSMPLPNFGSVHQTIQPWMRSHVTSLYPHRGND